MTKRKKTKTPRKHKRRNVSFGEDPHAFLGGLDEIIRETHLDMLDGRDTTVGIVAAILKKPDGSQFVQCESMEYGDADGFKMVWEFIKSVEFVVRRQGDQIEMKLYCIPLDRLAEFAIDIPHASDEDELIDGLKRVLKKTW